LVEEVLPAFETVWIGEEIHRSAEAALLAAPRRRVSFVDWVSFEVMRREGIERAFAFDRDFTTQGFDTVP
jgi:predicted nucleic acid-binding protein